MSPVSIFQKWSLMWENDFILQWRSSGPCKALGLLCGEQGSFSVPELLKSLAVALPSEVILGRSSVGGFLMPLATTVWYSPCWTSDSSSRRFTHENTRMRARGQEGVRKCMCEHTQKTLAGCLQWYHFRKPSSYDLNHEYWQHFARATYMSIEHGF